MERVRQIFEDSRRRRDVNVISMGLYGSSAKYCTGALRNADLVGKYFPGWTLRIYVDKATVPESTITQLRAKGVHVKLVRSSGAAAAGMFWRFYVADDAAVTRFLVRDSDSRLNARDAAAVADWMLSPFQAHSVRDHPNHDRPLNGGLWGATNASSIAGTVRRRARRFADHDSYGADLDFLQTAVLPVLDDDLLAHDAYTCTKYANSRPFPTKRPRDFQHVGQVFDEFDRPRMDDIDSFTRGRPAPLDCRGRPDWLYG